MVHQNLLLKRLHLKIFKITDLHLFTGFSVLITVILRFNRFIYPVEKFYNNFTTKISNVIKLVAQKFFK